MADLVMKQHAIIYKEDESHHITDSEYNGEQPQEPTRRSAVPHPRIYETHHTMYRAATGV